MWNKVKKMFKRKKKTENVMLRSRHMGDGKYEVGGVVFYADTHAEAIRKYRRGKANG